MANLSIINILQNRVADIYIKLISISKSKSRNKSANTSLYIKSENSAHAQLRDYSLLYKLYTSFMTWCKLEIYKCGLQITSWMRSRGFSWKYFLVFKFVYVCLYCSAVEASFNCKTSETYLRGTDKRCYAVSIIPGASAKFLHLHF